MFNILKNNSYPRINELKAKLKRISYTGKKSYDKYLKAFKIYNLYKMEEFFYGPTFYRGMILFYEDKVINYKKTSNIHFCNVINNGNKYNVMVKINFNKIIDSSCTCKYHEKYGKERLCKHVGALVTKIYHRVDVELLRCELIKKLNKLKDILDDVDYIIKNESKYFKKDVLKQLEKDYDTLLSYYENELGHVNAYNTETEMVANVRSIDILNDIILEYLNVALNNQVREEGIVLKVNVGIKINVEEPKKKKTSLIDLVNIVSDVVKTNPKKDKVKNTIWDTNIYDLEDWQKELVKKGEYDSWSFEEPGGIDKLEEDDYYYEDDK